MAQQCEQNGGMKVSLVAHMRMVLDRLRLRPHIPASDTREPRMLAAAAATPSV